jgi:hypothetical protein
MKTFKQYLLEFTRVDVPNDGRTAPTRYNNPGGAYPKSGLERYGMEGYGIIGGGHKIAKYPTPGHGVAANIAHLRTMPIVGRTLGQARHYWVNGNFSGSMDMPGMNPSQVITSELLKDQNWLAQWMVTTAKLEGFKGPLDQSVFDQAFRLLDGTSTYDPSNTPSSTQQQGDVTGENKPEESPPETQEYSSWGDIAKNLKSAIKTVVDYGKNF